MIFLFGNFSNIKIKILARPKSSIENLKSFQVNVRITVKEQFFLKEQAKIHGLSMVQYIRVRALKNQLPKNKMSGINRELLIELSRVGNNINQIAKKMNQGSPYHSELKQTLYGLDVKLNNLKQELLK